MIDATILRDRILALLKDAGLFNPAAKKEQQDYWGAVSSAIDGYATSRGIEGVFPGQVSYNRLEYVDVTGSGDTSHDLGFTPKGKPVVYLNGSLLRYGGGNDYTHSGKTVTINTTVAGGDVLGFSYEVRTYPKLPARTSSSSNVSNLGSAPASIDDVDLKKGERVLLFGQSSAPENGIYYVDSVNLDGTLSLSRDTDFDEDSEVKQGAYVFVLEGTSRGGNEYILTDDDPLQVGTDDLTFSKVVD